MIRIGLDSNILVYFAGIAKAPADREKIERVRGLIAQLSHAAALVAPTQALGELFVVLRRTGLDAEEARAILMEFSARFAPAASENATLLAAADLVADHKLQFWDALIITSTVEAGCSLLLSEDMQHGFVVRGMTVVNPFTMPVHDRLAALLRPA